LSAEDAQAQAMPDASPTKWHLAHTTWFFEEFVLAPYLSSYRRFHESFDALFNSYYDTVGPQWPRAERALITRPGLAEVMAYRAQVDHALVEGLRPGAPHALPPAARERIVLGLAHEEQHQELILTDILALLARHPFASTYAAATPTHGTRASAPEAAAPSPRWAHFEAARVAIGDGGASFAFDHERPRHDVLVPAFALATRPVTNGELAEFVADGGYRTSTLWLADGWQAAQANGWTAPLYWERDGATWTTATLHGREPLDVAAPVAHLSFYEADAYARWAKARLPTEQEWEHAATGYAPTGHFLGTGPLRPTAAKAAREAGAGGDAPAGDVQLHQLFGDVWEWTASAFRPYPGFRPLAGGLGEYNGKFMCNQMVLRGGSCVTPPGHVRATYRNFFPPAARWQFTGVRLARDA
jgi:ergothioneine biosynthesis protein EgtB